MSRFKIITLLLSFPIALQAHAFLDYANPAVGSSNKKSPAEVRITFSERIEPTLSSIKVFDSNGKEVDKGNQKGDAENKKILLIGVPLLTQGSYKVVWRAVSVDTHVTNGEFSFQIKP
ncbi:MAG: copper resistance CopC family protein [Chthoniobacterales bacterium]